MIPQQRGRLWLVILLCLPCGTLPERAGRGQSAEFHSADPAGVISSTQRLAVEQVNELVATGQTDEAWAQLQKLVESGPALIASGPIQLASTQRVQTYATLSSWCIRQQHLLSSSDDRWRQRLDQQWRRAAEVAYRALQEHKSPQSGRDAVVQYHASSGGPQLLRLLTDIYLERGQTLAAVQVLETFRPDFIRLDLSQLNPHTASVRLPWHRVWQAVRDDEPTAQRLIGLWTTVSEGQAAEVVDLLSRQLAAAAISPELLDLDSLRAWSVTVAEHLPDLSQRERLLSAIDEAATWPPAVPQQPLGMLAASPWPSWQVQLERYSNAHDVTPASKPRVGERQALLPYHPLIYEGKVFVHELTRIRGWDLASGQPWPNNQADLALFDSRLAGSTILPLGYPLQGAPRAELAAYDGCLYARLGPAVTAWASRSRAADDSSLSFLIGLDLDSQGRLLRGFPLRLAPPEFVAAEFEGCPAVTNQLLITTVVERDQASIRRRLAAFDRFSGQLVWRSEVLGSGIVAGSERANLIGNTRPRLAGGLLYYLSDLGSVACLDPHNGQTIWLARYQRSSRPVAESSRPQRFRYRDGNAPLVHQGLVYCLPQDCPELFALDALSGDLVWSTDDQELQDATYLAGIRGQTLLASGDRLVWLDRTSGRLAGGFPLPTTPGIVTALPQPRGLGQAALQGDRVYWPTAKEILVFPADVAVQPRMTFVDSPPLLHRWPIDSRGSEGGNLIVAEHSLLMASPGRLFNFRAPL